MSVTFSAYIRAVPNMEQLLAEHLRLPVEETTDNRYQVQSYFVDLTIPDGPSIKNTLEFFGSYRFFHYFEFGKYGDSWIRVELFDYVRALGLREMWFVSEILLDYFEKDEYESIEDAMNELQHCMPRHKQYCMLSEYDAAYFRSEIDEKWGITKKYMGGLYHDSFTDLFEKVDKIESAYGVRVLGLKLFDDDFIRVEREGKVEFMKMPEEYCFNKTIVTN